MSDDLAEAEKKLANAELYRSISVVCAIICSLLLVFGLTLKDGAGAISMTGGLIFLFSLMGLCLSGMFFPTGKDSPESARVEVDSRKSFRQKLKREDLLYQGRRERQQEKQREELGLAANLLQEGGLANLQKVLNIYSKYSFDGYDSVKKEIAQKKEKLLDYEGAIADFKELGLHQDAKRVRRKMLDERKVDQTVVHGDYVDDRDTIVKDSVINRSNIGAGGDDKFTKLKELTEMKEKGLIDDAEFKQMKKEILGK